MGLIGSGLGFNHIRRTRCGSTCRLDNLKPSSRKNLLVDGVA